MLRIKVQNTLRQAKAKVYRDPNVELLKFRRLTCIKPVIKTEEKGVGSTRSSIQTSGHATLIDRPMKSLYN